MDHLVDDFHDNSIVVEHVKDTGPVLKLYIQKAEITLYIDRNVFTKIKRDIGTPQENTPQEGILKDFSFRKAGKILYNQETHPTMLLTLETGGVIIRDYSFDIKISIEKLIEIASVYGKVRQSEAA